MQRLKTRKKIILVLAFVLRLPTPPPPPRPPDLTLKNKLFSHLYLCSFAAFSFLSLYIVQNRR